MTIDFNMVAKNLLDRLHYETGTHYYHTDVAKVAAELEAAFKLGQEAAKTQQPQG